MNFAPAAASEITLFNRIFVSNKDAAGEPGSESKGSLSPLTTILTLQGSAFNGQ